MTAAGIRIGAGAGYAGDRITPAVELAGEPTLDYLVFECLAERTIAIAQQKRQQDPDAGYNTLLPDRMQRVLPKAVEHDITIISNMGAANPEAAAAETRAIARDLDLEVTVAAVSGCDVFDQFHNFEAETLEGEPVDSYQDSAVSASAYLGVSGVVTALDRGADIVITGRVADTSLFLAPAIYEFEWSLTPLHEPDLVGQGVAAAHLIECAGQVTGGYFADPGYKPVENLSGLGFPIADLSADGTLAITKLPGTGGIVSERTCTEQMLYEIHDPAEYITPDAIADFSQITLTEVDQNRVQVDGATARKQPPTLRVNIGYEDAVIGEGQISYGGPGAPERATLAGEIVKERLQARDIEYQSLQVDRMGIDSLHGALGDQRGEVPYEVRLRVVGKCKTDAAAAAIGREVERLYTNGPAGGGGVTRTTSQNLGLVSTLIDRSHVSPTVTVEGA